MNASRHGLLRRLKNDDSGVALVMVVGATMVVATLLLVGLAYAVNSTKYARYDQDYTAAMAAAQSGVDDFISRLNRDDNYGQTVDCLHNDAMVTPAACGQPYGWAPVIPGNTAPDAAMFHYSADATTSWTNGTIMVTSTGRVNNVYRTIEVAVGKGGSTDYVYYTDFEDGDPDNTNLYPSGAPSRACGRDGASLASYFWQGRSGCAEIMFGQNDVLDGKVFTNDSILSIGGRFLQSVESANTGCNSVVPGNVSTWSNCLRPGSSFVQTGSSATFQVAPAYHQLLRLADSSAVFSTYPGCHYYGATRIIFNSNGTMTVWSKDSDFSGAVTSIAPPTGAAPNCGSGTALASTGGATVDVPSGMVVYVEKAPTSGPGAVLPRQLYANEIGGPTGSELPLGTYTGAAPTNSSSTYTFDANMADPRKYAGEGNLYVQGVVNGRVTLATAQSIVVTGDLVLKNGPDGSDLLGLVATNSVEVMHPWMEYVTAYRSHRHYYWNTYSYGGSEYTSATWPQRIIDPARGTVFPSQGIQIAGSIQTLQHSFTVQYYRDGPIKGDLFVMGSIAQRWRGAVGTGTSWGTPVSGYAKDYRYDVRLRYTAPPYWPHWVNAQWSLRYSGEVNTPDALRSP